MRYMSFALTTDQVRNRTKTVTRRMRWADLKPGTLLQPIVKGQGLKKGAKVEKIGGPIRVVSVRREPLDLMLGWPANVRYGIKETILEGFGHMTSQQFVEMFCKANGCEASAEVTRIEFEYL